MRTTLKKVSAMFLAILMVVTMASLLVVSAEVKNGSRKLGSVESLTLGTSAQYSTLGTSKNGKYFADSIGVWGFNGITSYAPLSNQNGIDIFVECTLGASTLYTKKNIYIDLGAWADGTASGKWAKYGTKTITIGFNANYNETTKVLTWTAIPSTGLTNPDDMLQFFSFKVDPDTTQGIQQIQLFKSDPVASFVNGPSIWSGENGVWNVIFQECTQQTTDNQACTATGAPGYVKNMDAEKALWFDLFYSTHAYTKLFGYDFNIAGQTSYNTKDTNAKLDFVLTDGTLVYTEWDISSSQYLPKTTTGVTGPLDLTLLAATLPGTKTTDAYNKAAYDFFLATQDAGGAFTVTKDDPRTATTSATLVPANAKITYAYTGLKGYLRLTWTTSSALTGVQTVTAAGGEDGDGAKFNLVANQSQIRTAAELEAGSLLYWEYVAFTSNYQGFGTPTLYPANQNSYADIIYKAARAVETTWSFDQKIQDLTADMNLVDATPAGKVDLQLVPIIGGDNLIAGLVETDASSTPKNLRNYGLTVNYYVDYSNAFMSQMTIDIHEKTIDTLTAYAGGKADLVVKVAEGKMVKDYSCKITQYDETFVIPLKDGTFTLLRIKVRTNYDDQVGPLAVADITDFNYSRLTMAEQVKFYPDRLYNANGTATKDRIYGGNANKVLYVDLINAIPGSVGADSYWTYNDEKVGYFKVDGFNGKNYYTALTALLSYVGFNADGSKPNRNPVGYSKFYNTIDTTLSLTAKQLWDTSFRLVYNKGTGTTQESITEVFYPLTPAQTLKYAAADGNTYVYSVFFHTQYGDMPVQAIPLGVAQKASAKITAMGEYTYVLGLIPAGSAATKANFKAGTNPTTDTGKGYAVGQMLKTETNGTITITNYWDNTRGLATTGSGVSNYNKAITILAVRIPAGATLTVGKNGNGLNATVVDLKYGTIGLNSPDGLIDAYVTIEYASVADTAFTLTVNYDDAPDDGIKKASEGSGFKRTWDVKSTWVVRTTNDIATTNAASVAYNKFTSAVGKTLTPAAAVMPSNPNEAQVVSSTPAASTVVSAPSDTSTPAMGNPFNAIAYIITIGASAIGGISTLIIRKRK